jgi:hypothetical protein
MEKHIFITALMLIVAIRCTNTSKDDFPTLKGDFLGQQLPDDKPVIFAPGIISTERYERDLAISRWERNLLLFISGYMEYNNGDTQG